MTVVDALAGAVVVPATVVCGIVEMTVVDALAGAVVVPTTVVCGIVEMTVVDALDLQVEVALSKMNPGAHLPVSHLFGPVASQETQFGVQGWHAKAPSTAYPVEQNVGSHFPGFLLQKSQ
jgi:hypothetical protein